MKNPYYYIKGFLKKVFVGKLYFNRAHNYVALPLDLSKDFMIFMTFLKVYYNDIHYGVALPWFLGLLCIMLGLGYLDVKYKLAHLENGIMNTVNPELQEIYKIREDIKWLKRNQEKKK